MVEAAMKVMNSLDCPHGEYIILDYNQNKLVFRERGNGITELKNALHDDQVSFVLLALRLELQGIPDQVRLIFMHWKGPAVKRMVMVKANQFVQQALEILSPNHGQLEVIGKNEFTEAIISEKWKPSAGSHVIN
ncbi:hypothetical protein KM1_199260 [Entamoeba histolytica HM-3:IMSS]|uniref:ADF-H domain-containing protein n=4 Tax=Entamoeba TaxID=5758 RepID=C4M1S9_ENTH1|nr:hypothetical protein EHI_164480 [Entamoeba histolytica HM-1:IMSS]EAL42992.1 hypothetical protein EHI_164480 [Entamoeba histolytica HM-1:IMSS]EMS10696.1 hypothetical protein KM1_199260 [Entamoeba histolytica HM-3:IMSS]GAT95191.1 hypothetical protein CL6EHI_164480 [Entamoeba histolytica]|eukprot:XP_648377.1 hypothetical protein EHI_164480 [Entamoeba histolytica HM-1:IMSS]